LELVLVVPKTLEYYSNTASDETIPSWRGRLRGVHFYRSNAPHSDSSEQFDDMLGKLAIYLSVYTYLLRPNLMIFTFSKTYTNIYLIPYTEKTVQFTMYLLVVLINLVITNYVRKQNGK